MVINERGFTLLELMMVVGIMGIVMAIAAPSFSEMLANQRMRDTTFDLQASLLRARNESLTRNTTVSVVPVAGNWSSGWTIANPAQTDPTLPGFYIEQHAAIPNVTVVGPGGGIAYNNLGRVGTSASLDIYGAATALKRCVMVEINGRPHSKPCACTSGC